MPGYQSRQHTAPGGRVAKHAMGDWHLTAPALNPVVPAVGGSIAQQSLTRRRFVARAAFAQADWLGSGMRPDARRASCATAIVAKPAPSSARRSGISTLGWASIGWRIARRCRLDAGCGMPGPRRLSLGHVPEYRHRSLQLPTQALIPGGR